MYCVRTGLQYSERLVNSEYMKQALAKVGNPNILVNLVSRRVRQLTSGGGNSRPLVDQASNLGAADIALLEIIEEKMGFLANAEGEEEIQPSAKKRRGR